MNQASVGFHCPECLAKNHTRVVTARGLGTFKPVVTMVLMGINIAAWVLGQIIWKPREITTTSDGAIAAGALLSNGIELSRSSGRVGHAIGIAQGEWYRVFTSGFLHVSILHLGVNMWALWVLGKVTEQALGRTRMGLIYMVSLAAGSFGAMVVSPHSITLGASGAIFGLMGGLLVVAKTRGIAMRDSGLLGVVGFNLVLTFFLSSYLSVGGHIGGLIGGALAAFVIIDIPNRIPALRGQAKEAYVWVSALAMIVVLTFGAMVLANQAGKDVPIGVGVAAPAFVIQGHPGPVHRRGVGS